MLPTYFQRSIAAGLFIVTAILLATAAIAQSGIMVNEALLMDDDLLTMLDTDGNAILSSDEYTYYRNRLFNQNDANHDGSISAQEFADHARAVFADMDANHDGSLTRDEIIAAHADMLRMMYKNPHAPNVDTLADTMIGRMDTDHNGRISAQEYDDAMKARFGELDANNDGTVSKREFNGLHRLHAVDDAVK